MSMTKSKIYCSEITNFNMPCFAKCMHDTFFNWTPTAHNSLQITWPAAKSTFIFFGIMQPIYNILFMATQ